ncbi:MAG: hypothetical protein M3P51_10645, partial [Chloroflexota bacterium]|nr:hypothetical protein [Chloroflexota bacterium]
PKLGMNTESAVISRWLKNEGDAVSVGDVLAEVETDKVNMDLEAESAGILRKVLVADGDRVSVNQTIAIIGQADEDVSALVAQAVHQASGDTSHVESVYESWRSQAVPFTTAEVDSPARPAPVPSPADQGRVTRLDPDAIRARLAQRGVLPNVEAKGPSRSRVAIYGAGLGAKQLLEVTRHLESVEVLGIIDDSESMKGAELAGIRVLGGFATLQELASKGSLDGVALSFHSEVRKKVHERIIRELNVVLIPLVDPRAILGMEVEVGAGALVEAGAVVGPGTTIGEGTIVDVGAVVAHDCYLGAFSHLSPGCRLSGVVSLKENVLVGVGASINSTVTVGRNVIIAPGAAVMNDVPDDVVVSGVPAKIIGESRRGAASS